MEFDFFGRKFGVFSLPEQWEKIKVLFTQYFLHPVVLGSFTFLLFYFAFYFYKREKSGSPVAIKKIKSYAPITYLIFIISLALLNRTPGIRCNFHFAFDFILEGTTEFHETRVLMAIFDFLYYIPYGFIICWSHPKLKAYWVILLASLTGLAMEILQWFFALGLGTVEHWLLYTSGAATGVICTALQRRFGNIRKKKLA